MPDLPGKGDFVIGTAQWGSTYGIANSRGCPDDGELRRMIEEAERHGVHFIDTARDYGMSEDRIGRILGGEAGWTVMTKLSASVCSGEPPDEIVRSSVIQSLDESAAALRTDHISVLLLHRGWQLNWHDGIVWSTLQSLKKEGRVECLGVSASNPAEALAAIEEPSVDVVQVAYSALDRRLVDNGLFRIATGGNRRIVCRSAFLQGAALLGPADLASRLALLAPAIHKLEQLSKREKISRAELLLRFARDTAPGAVVVGAEEVSQLASNLRAWSTSALDDGILGEIASAGQGLPWEILDPAQWSQEGMERGIRKGTKLAERDIQNRRLQRGT